jgi:hypothetical protein
MLAEKTNEAAIKVDDAKERIERAEAKLKKAIDLATVLARARDYLRSKNFASTQTPKTRRVAPTADPTQQ